MNPRKYLTLLVTCAVVTIPGLTHGDTLFYNPGQNLGWFDATSTQWGVDGAPYETNWSNGNSATIDQPGNLTINFAGSASVVNLTSMGGGSKILTSLTGTNVMTFSGGTISVTSGSLFFQSGAGIQGNFTKTGGGTLANSTGTGKQAYVGTATITAGTLYYDNGAQLGLSSHFLISGGTLLARENALSAGSVILNSGALEFGRNNSDTKTGSLTVTSFSGGGGTVQMAPINSGNAAPVQGFTVNQTTDTSFAGNIDGVLVQDPGTQRLRFTKSGTGKLTLSGAVTLGTETTVSGGGLFINGETTDFSAVTGTTAISVDGGTLGGTGVINVTGGDNVVLGAAGKLAAGLEGSAGRTTYDFDSGSLDLSAATGSANTGWLKFELGSRITPGTTYDQILLSGGSLNIGAGLNFSDFAFTDLGLQGGSYVLFQTPNEILGSLGVINGTIGGFDASLAIAGNNLVLNVVPEPSTFALFTVIGLTGIAWVRRRRRFHA